MSETLTPGFMGKIFRLDGKVALMTGGRGALAEAMGAALADLGCAVAFASRHEEECAELAAGLAERFGTRAIGLRCDISREEEVEAAVAQTVERLGKIDILINNAGASWWGLPQDIPLTGWRKVVDVNLTGTFLACRHAARHMIASGGGAIINIASVGAFLSYTPDAGQVVPYTTTKAAIVHLTRDLAAQWAGHGIRVNAIAPGSVETGMTETLTEDIQQKLLNGILLQRFGKPSEVAGVLAVLASEAGAFITGQTFIVDGDNPLPEHQITTYAADGLTWTEASLWQQFDALAAAAPEALAIVAADGRNYTRAEMHRMASATIAALRQQGIGAHDRVLLEGRKTAPTLSAALAISAVGGIICPFTPGLGKADRQALESRLGHVAVIGDAEGEPIPETQGLRLALRDMADPASRDPRDLQTALIGFTSGTTGVPKGVMHSSAAMNYAARGCAIVAGLEAGDAIIGVVPLGSAPGFTFTAHFALSQGRPLVIVDPWDAVQALALMDQYACRWGICVPTQLVGFIEAAKTGKWTTKSPLKALAVGGSAMTPGMVADSEELLGIRVLRMFGMSECMGHASTRPADPPERRRNSDGLPFPGTRDEAFDAELRLLPRGQRGQAGVRGPSLCLGYAKGMGDQDFRLTPDGYLLTGDEIICDEDGYLKVVGRIKDQIIRGGYNVDPAEVEAALLRYPLITNVAVIAVPEARLGEQACAICCIREGHARPQLSDLTAHLAEVGLSKKKWPEHLLIVDDMLYTATGKIDKKSLAKMAISQLGLG